MSLPGNISRRIAGEMVQKGIRGVNGPKKPPKAEPVRSKAMQQVFNLLYGKAHE